MKSYKIYAHALLDKFNVKMFVSYPRPFERFAVKGNGLIGAEIGVFRGRHAFHILNNISIRNLYLIDPYESYEEFGSKGMYDELLDAKIEAGFALREFDNISWIYKNSSDAVKLVPNNLDFVYIDGNHEYNFVKEDIENYYPKLKVGGVLGGHDITIPDVAKAVCELVAKYDLEINIRLDDWWIIKK